MSKIYSLLFFILLASCDSSGDKEIQIVDRYDRISDKELRQQQQQRQQRPDGTYYFGFDLRSSPQEDAAQYLPFLQYLENTTGYSFKLHFTPKNSSTVEELGQNKIQFAAMGATSFLKAQSKYRAISLVRGINNQGTASYQSVFVVKPKSSIKNIKDIVNQRLAFGGRDSTQGHLIPRIVLMKNNISLKDLDTYTYTGSHQSCAEAVVAGKSNICAMQDQMAENLSSQGLLRIIHRSLDYPSSGIVVNNLVPADVVIKVKEALLGFDPEGKHRKTMYHWEKTEMPKGFVSSNEQDYKELRQWMIKLSFLHTIDISIQESSQ